MSEAILLSGGMDSVALAYWRRPAVGITIDYGQASAEGEIRAATQICLDLSMRHELIRVNCRELGSGDLAGVPPSVVAPVPEWWPFRNQLLITLAGMKAVSLGVNSLLFGAVATDGQHADGKREFFEQMDRLLRFQEGSISVTAPAIEMTTVDLIRQSGISRELLAWSHSCHTAAFACGRCRGCNKHGEVLQALGYAAD